VGANSCSFLTADGGFDFSGDFNSQETQCYPLMLSEIYIGLCLQATGGHFLLKVFDVLSIDTMLLIAICSLSYNKMFILKPTASRPANSEKYILFYGYNKYQGQQSHVVREKMADAIKTKTRLSNDIISADVLHDVVDAVTQYNIVYSFNQIHHIKKTLEFKLDVVNDAQQRTNENLCKEWCEAYKLL
jgi:23S rRNA U2552 (ribose-2'-O)-methylase RlmE/FtsJ